MRWTKTFASSALWMVIAGCAIGCGGGGDSASVTPGDDGGAGDGAGDSSNGDTGFPLDSSTDGSGGDSKDGSGDGASTDSGSGDTAPDGADTASTDTGSADTGPADTGPADTGPADTGPIDTGVDTAPDPCGTLACSIDTDGDTIPDSVEGRCIAPPTDTDGDGTPDYLDLDSDNDTIPDKVEWAAGGCDPTAPFNDADGDGQPNFRDLDSDENGVPDIYEICPVGLVISGCAAATPADTDGDGAPDWLDSENDHDSPSPDLTIGLEDKFEVVDNAGVYKGPKILVPYKTYDASTPLVDTDSDGVPDVWDRDSDNDNIFDLTDGLGDPDKDGIPNFRDVDSDGDGVGDVCEARANPVFTPSYAEAAKALLDTNADGIYDYLQRDTDGDYLIDGAGPLGDPVHGEDKNANCIVDTGETDRLKWDTDGDGVSDFIEVTLVDVACAKDPTCTPAKKGKFYFVEPYSPTGSIAPTPTSSPLALSTQLNQGDVGIIMDATGSMGPVLSNLQSSLSTTIIPALKTKIPSLGIGVGVHDDYPVSPYGGAGDLPWYVASPPKGYVTTVTSDSQTAVNSVVLGWGNDLSESQVEAMYHALTGAALTWSGGSTPSDTGSPPSTFGGLHFRSTALPILLEITDAPFHSGYSVAVAGLQYAYSGVTAYTSGDVVTQLNTLGAKFIGVAADNGVRGSCAGPSCNGWYGDPYNFQAYISDNSGSDVPPSAFGGSCGAGLCCTGVGGAGVTPDGPGGTCRSVFSISHGGTGMSTSIVSGVYALLASIKFDVYVQAYNDPAATIDVVTDFMQKVEPQPSGGTDPVTGGVCVTFPASQLADRWTGPKAVVPGADGVWDTIKAVNPGSLYCFNVVPLANKVVTPTSTAQIFTAWLRVLAQKPAPSSGTFTLGTDRQVLFIVPPIIN